MEPTFQLTLESARALALRLFSRERFKSDPKGCIVAALDWLDRAAGEPIPGDSAPVAKLARDSRIERLDRMVGERGPEAVAKEIGVSRNSLRAWLHGAPPNSVSFTKIERFLAEGQSQPPDAVGARESARPGELFEPQPPVKSDE